MRNFKKNIISIYAVNLINGIAGIAFIPLALRGLGIEGYGLYSMFTLFTSYVIFVELGITKYFTRDLAKEKESDKQKEIMQLAIGIYYRITAVLVFLTPVLVYAVPTFLFPIEDNLPIIEIILLFAVVDYLISIPISIMKTYNIGNEMFVRVSKFNLVAGLSRHFFLIAAVLVFDSVILVMAVVIIRRFIEILYARKFLSALPEGAWKPKYMKGSFRRILSQSILLSGAQISQVLVLTIGTYLVNKYFGLRTLGVYKSSFDLASKVWFFSNSLGIVIFPRFAALLKEQKEEKKLLKKLIKYNLISWVLYLSFFTFVTFTVPYFEDFLVLEDPLLFILLLLAISLNAHSNISYEYLHASYRVKETIVLNFMSLLLIYLIFYLTIGEFGIYAIGIAWIGSQLIYTLILDFFVFYRLGLTTSIPQSLYQLFLFALFTFFVFEVMHI